MKELINKENISERISILVHQILLRNKMLKCKTLFPFYCYVFNQNQIKSCFEVKLKSIPQKQNTC